MLLLRPIQRHGRAGFVPLALLRYRRQSHYPDPRPSAHSPRPCLQPPLSVAERGSSKSSPGRAA